MRQIIFFMNSLGYTPHESLQNLRASLVAAAEYHEFTVSRREDINVDTVEKIVEEALRSAINWAVRAVCSSNGNTADVVEKIENIINSVLSMRPSLNGRSEQVLLAAAEAARQKTAREVGASFSL